MIFYDEDKKQLAYTIESMEEEIVIVVMAGTRENFYDQLKRYMKG